MRGRTALWTILTLLGLGIWLQAQDEVTFEPAQVAVHFSSLEGRDSLREALKGALERGSGPLDVAVNDLTDVPLELVLVRLSATRPVRVLLGVGGVDPASEAHICEEMNELFPVRRLEGLGHRFAVSDAGVVLSALDWTPEALTGPAQEVVELVSSELAARYRARFEALWEAAKPGCG